MREHPPTRGDNIPVDRDAAPAMVEQPALTDPSWSPDAATPEPGNAEPQIAANQPTRHQSVEHPAVVAAAPPATPAADAGASS
jgi:cell division protein FtsN